MPYNVLILLFWLSGLHCDKPVEIVNSSNASEVSSSFVVKNKSAMPVTGITAVASCGCTAISLSRNDLMPGEDAKLYVTVKVKHEYGPHKISIVVSGCGFVSPIKLALITYDKNQNSE
jgi:Protein of unknown function (DUF1573)